MEYLQAVSAFCRVNRAVNGMTDRDKREIGVGTGKTLGISNNLGFLKAEAYM